MSAYLQCWRAIMAHAFDKRGRLLFAAGLLSIAAICIGFGLRMGQWQSAVPAYLGLFLILMLMAIWTAFISGVWAQNTPGNINLVPGLRRRLMTLTIVFGLGASTVPPLLLSVGAGHAVMLMIGMGFWLTGVLIARADNLLAGLVVLLLPMFAGVAACRMRPESLDAFGRGHVLPVLALILLALAFRGICALFPSKADRQWRQWSRQAKYALAANGDQVLIATKGGGLAARVYAKALRRDSERGGVERLLLHVLGPTAHPSYLGVALATCLLLTLLVMAVLRLAFGIDLASDALLPLIVVQLCSLLYMMQAQFLGLAFYKTGGEQALLRLAPSMPSCAGFNLALAWLIVRRLLGYAIGVLVFTVLAMLLFGVSLSMQAGPLALISLPIMASTLALRNYARAAHPDAVWNVAGLLSSVSGVGLAYLMSRQTISSGNMLALASICLLVTLLIGRWRWQTMVAAPVAFPAGRIA